MISWRFGGNCEDGVDGEDIDLRGFVVRRWNEMGLWREMEKGLALALGGMREIRVLERMRLGFMNWGNLAVNKRKDEEIDMETAKMSREGRDGSVLGCEDA